MSTSLVSTRAGNRMGRSGVGFFAPVGLLMAILATGGSAAAQPPGSGASPGIRSSSSDASRRAEELFRKGNELYKASKWAEAEASYLEAWSLQRTYDLAANLGHTEFKLGKEREAAEHLSFALSNWPLTAKSEQRELAQQRFAEVRQKIGALSVRASVAGADVWIDNQRVGKTPLAAEMFVLPGKHTVRASLEGYEPVSQTIVVDQGGSREVALALQRLAVQRSDASGPRKSTALIVSGAVVSAAAVGAGVGLTLAANGKGNEATGMREGLKHLEAGCPTLNSDQCAQTKEALATQSLFSNLALASFIVGGAAGVATFGYALWPTAGKSSQKFGVQVVPIVATSQGGLEVTGRF